MHNTHLDIYQLIHRQHTTKALVLISTAVAGETGMSGQQVEAVKLVWCDIPADVALYRAIQTCHEFVEWLSRQVTGLCFDIVSQRPIPIPSPFQVDARPGHFPQDPGKVFASISCMTIASADVKLTTMSGGHHCCSNIATNKPKLSSRSTSDTDV